MGRSLNCGFQPKISPISEYIILAYHTKHNYIILQTIEASGRLIPQSFFPRCFSFQHLLYVRGLRNCPKAAYPKATLPSDRTNKGLESDFARVQFALSSSCSSHVLKRDLSSEMRQSERVAHVCYGRGIYIRSYRAVQACTEQTSPLQLNCTVLVCARTSLVCARFRLVCACCAENG